MTTYTTPQQRENIKEVIQTELLKRGYHAPIIHIEEVEGRGGKNRIEFHTDTFQTTPVLFKSLRVSNFSSAISLEQQRDDKYGNVYSIWIQVSVRYVTFDNGSNGTHLFTFNASITEADHDLRNVKCN